MTNKLKELKVKKYRVKPDEFLAIMKRIEMIKQEIKEEKEFFDLKMKSLELEKQYLENKLQAK